jgi:IS30 family transposase
VSHEIIYRSLYAQARGVLKQELIAHLRSQRRFRRSRHATQKQGERGQIVNPISISGRPAFVEDRAVRGHWDGDLLCGSTNGNIVALLERHSRYVMLAKVPSSATTSVSPWKLTLLSISATRKALGSRDRTKTPTGCCANTFLAGRTWRRIRGPISRWRASSTSAPGKR